MKPTLVTFLSAILLAGLASTADPLLSWNGTEPRQAIVAFVVKVTTEGTADFVSVSERIAVFDNDGTLWSEQPMYFQAFFVILDKNPLKIDPQNLHKLQVIETIKEGETMYRKDGDELGMNWFSIPQYAKWLIAFEPFRPGGAGAVAQAPTGEDGIFSG